MAEVDLFQAHRSRLFAVAYRMLGSASDAEDVVQDAWLRYSIARPADLRSPTAYLTTIVTRLCLDRLKSYSGNGRRHGRRARNTSGRGCPSRW